MFNLLIDSNTEKHVYFYNVYSPKLMEYYEIIDYVRSCITQFKKACKLNNIYFTISHQGIVHNNAMLIYVHTQKEQNGVFDTLYKIIKALENPLDKFLIIQFTYIVQNNVMPIYTEISYKIFRVDIKC